MCHIGLRSLEAELAHYRRHPPVFERFLRLGQPTTVEVLEAQIAMIMARLAELDAPHDVDAAVVEAPEPAVAILRGVDQDVVDREGQAGLEAFHSMYVDSSAGVLTPEMLRRGLTLKSPACRFPLAASDQSKGVLFREVF